MSTEVHACAAAGARRRTRARAMRSISVPRVAHRVVGGAVVRLDAARLAVVQPAGQLADHEHVGAGQHFRLERPGRLETRPDARRPQVRIQAERFRGCRAAPLPAARTRDRLSNAGSPTAPSRMAIDACAAASVSSGSGGSPCFSAAAPMMASAARTRDRTCRRRYATRRQPRPRLPDRCRRQGEGEWWLSQAANCSRGRSSGLGVRSRVEARHDAVNPSNSGLDAGRPLVETPCP